MKYYILLSLLFLISLHSFSQCEKFVLDAILVEMEKGEFIETEISLTNYIECNKKRKILDYKAYYLRGYCKKMKGKLSLAIEDFDSSIRINDYYYESYYERGTCFFLLSLYDDAIRDYYYAYQIDADADACHALGYAYYESGQYNLAIKFLSESINQIQWAKSYILRAKSKLLNGDIKGGIEDTDIAEKLDSNNPKIIENRVWITALESDKDEMCKYYKLLEKVNTGDLFKETLNMYKSECLGE